MDPLLGQKVLLFVFYLGRVVEGRVHIPVALGVRDALHGLGCGLSEGDGRVGALDGKELKLLPGVFALLSLCAGCRLLLLSLFLALLDPVLQQPEEKAGHGSRDPHHGDQAADAHFNHTTV